MIRILVAAPVCTMTKFSALFQGRGPRSQKTR